MNYLTELQPIWQALAPIGAGILFYFVYIMLHVRFLESKEEWEMVLRENGITQKTYQRTMLKWLDTSFHIWGAMCVGVFSGTVAITLYLSGTYTVLDSVLIFLLLLGLRWSGDLFLNWRMRSDGYDDWTLWHQGKDNFFDKVPIPYRLAFEGIGLLLLIINKLLTNF